MVRIHWQFVLSKAWKAIVIGLLLAVGVVLIPRARCVLAGECKAASDLWCNWGQPGDCCEPSTGFKAVEKCTLSDTGSYCVEIVKTVPVRCNPQSGNCWVTEVLGSPNRLVWKPEERVYYWYVGSCPSPSGGQCGAPRTDTNRHRATCCSGNSGGGSCTPSYAPPTIEDTYTVYPPYPIVWTQGSHSTGGVVTIPEAPPLPKKSPSDNAMSLVGPALGMTLNNIQAHGGQDTTCGSGSRANITRITVYVTLRQSSIDWILTELAQRYPGAHVKGTYPQYPETSGYLAPAQYALCAGTDGISGKGTPDATLNCRFFIPWDPGQYDVVVTACQSDGKCTTKTLPEPVKVWLLETTLGPGR